MLIGSDEQRTAGRCRLFLLTLATHGRYKQGRLLLTAIDVISTVKTCIFVFHPYLNKQWEFLHSENSVL